MLISLNWIRDFVDLPADLDVRALAEQFTCTTAEVETVEHLTCDAKGLVAGEILSIESAAASGGLSAVKVNIGGKQFDSVTAAKNVKAGDKVIYAPPGAHLPDVGEITERQVAGKTSAGMIVAGDSLGLAAVGQEAIHLPPGTAPGSPIDMSLFNDWIIEVDNKSITHRPDLWGHYGIAREIAAMKRLALKPYDVAPREELSDASLPEIPIVIDDPAKCRRYSGLRFTGVRPQPAPLWMQVRLAHVGMRPIDILVDLTNYVMADLGQPMHAFDGGAIDRIEVADAKAGEVFKTLDGVDRKLPSDALMIQCNRRSIALAGVMGGADTEVTDKTTSLLLESANFEPATIRRCATALGHRTEASARFEKSLDPENTVRAIQRFVHLAKPELPGLKLTSRLSDAFPEPPSPTSVALDPAFVGRYVGRDVSVDEIKSILEPLEFTISAEGEKLRVGVPTFRATKDISIEADLIEEIARCIGYGSIAPVLPTVTVRYAAPAELSTLERQTMTLLCRGGSYAEIHRPIWFDSDWLKQLKFSPGKTIRLRNPAAAGMEQLRTTLMPGMLAACDLNRRSYDSFELAEAGSVFPPDIEEQDKEREHRTLGLAVVAPGRKAAHEEALIRRLKQDIAAWAFQVRGASIRFAAVEPQYPWEDPTRTAAILRDDQPIGRLTVVPGAVKRNIDEHLTAWSIALAEVNLSTFVSLHAAPKKIPPIAVYPSIDVDFSVLTPSDRRYRDVETQLASYDHPLLRRLAFVDSFEGGSVPAGQRSLTFRATIADQSRTLTEDDIQSFRSDFIKMLEKQNLQLRA